MRKIPIIFFLILFVWLAWCTKKTENTDIVVDEASFDSPALLRVDDNTSINEQGLWDD